MFIKMGNALGGREERCKNTMYEESRQTVDPYSIGLQTRLEKLRN